MPLAMLEEIVWKRYHSYYIFIYILCFLLVGGKRNIAHSEGYLILFSLHNIQLVLAGGGDSATMKLLELDYIFCPSSARNIVSLYILAII